jgi:hypothetical protein
MIVVYTNITLMWRELSIVCQLCERSAGFRINSPLGNILVRPSEQNKRITFLFFIILEKNKNKQIKF